MKHEGKHECKPECKHDCKHECNLRNAYEEAYRLSCERLLECDSDTVCQNTKAVFSSETNTYSVRYFNQECRIKCENGSVIFEKPEETDTTEKVLILHYLVYARPVPLTGKHISFKEVPDGGSIYYDPFKKRAIDPLVKTFSNNLEGLVASAKSIGGGPETLGDVSVVVPVFPLVPVTYVIWQGDEEIGSDGTILFDSSVDSFLPAEDIVVAASIGTYSMIRAWKNRKEF